MGNVNSGGSNLCLRVSIEYEYISDFLKYNLSDARNMARDVQNVFYRIFAEVGGLDLEASQKLMKDMEKQRLYQADVWS
jgi:hypothetical protein